MHLNMMTPLTVAKPHRDIEWYGEGKLPYEDIRALLGGAEMISGLLPATYYWFVASYMMYSVFLLYYTRVP